MNFGPYQKMITTLVTGLIGWGFVVVASPDAAVSAAEWLGLAVVGATGLGVYAVPNHPSQAEIEAALRAFESVREEPR